jgi:hypothetical protein
MSILSSPPPNGRSMHLRCEIEISISASRISRLEHVSLARDREFRMEITLDRIRIVIICTDPDPDPSFIKPKSKKTLISTVL